MESCFLLPISFKPLQQKCNLRWKSCFARSSNSSVTRNRPAQWKKSPDQTIPSTQSHGFPDILTSIKASEPLAWDELSDFGRKPFALFELFFDSHLLKCARARHCLCWTQLLSDARCRSGEGPRLISACLGRVMWNLKRSAITSFPNGICSASLLEDGFNSL